MRKVFAPAIPTCSLLVAVVGIMVVAEPLAKLTVEAAFRLLGY